MQPKKPRFNPLILALALAAVLMVWSVLGGGSSGGSLFGSGDRVGLGSGSDRIGLSLVRSRGTARSERYGGSNYCEHHDRFCQSFHNNKN